jgi:hypothetical protein
MVRAVVFSVVFSVAVAVGVPEVPSHVTVSTAYGYNASAQAGWNTWAKSFNLTELVEGHTDYQLKGMYRLDCVGGPPSFPNSGIVCDRPGPKRDGTNPYHMCSKAQNDTTDWRTETIASLELAKPYLISGVLVGIAFGDELTASGVPFADLEAWIDLVSGWVEQNVASARTANGLPPAILYYNESDYVETWPYIPHNLTLFSMDDYHPAWMYPSAPVAECSKDGWPQPPHCDGSGLWVWPRFKSAVYPKLGPATKLLLVPPTWGSHLPCAGTPSVDCTNLTYTQWVQLGISNFTFYRDWMYNDSRIIGFDPWPLTSRAKPDQAFALGLLQMPELLELYTAIGKVVVDRERTHRALTSSIQ